jgi:hypothetical protein
VSLLFVELYQTRLADPVLIGDPSDHDDLAVSNRNDEPDETLCIG